MPDLTPDVEAMTAAKWTAHYCDAARNAPWYLSTLAALEERERLLGEREVDAPFAAVGRGLVDSSCTGAEWDRLLAAARAAWDSLLPKEPEVVTGPSGWKYRRHDGVTVGQWRSEESDWVNYNPRSTCIPPCDAPVVAKLMASAKEVGK